MKNRYFTGTLILLVLLTCGILIKANSQIPLALPKFRVAVNVECDNQAHQSQVEGAIKRELRSYGDVQIVGNDITNGLWEYRINVHLFGIKDPYGNIHQYAISSRFYEKVPINHIVPDWQAYYRKHPAIFIPTGSTGYVGVNKMEEIAKTYSARFDKDYLQPMRDIRSRYSR